MEPCKERFTVVVQLFAAAAQVAGRRHVLLEMLPGATLQDVRESLLIIHPELAQLLLISRWAIDMSFVSDNTLVTAESVVAMIPPVSGG